MTLETMSPKHTTPTQSPRADDSAPAAFQVAIVGCGPKGLYCLERLTDRLKKQHPQQPVRVTVFEPAEYCGAGRTYDPNQPHWLRMNYSSRHVDAWSAEQRGTDQGSSLTQWLQQEHPRLADPHAFVPRAIVGEYLHDCFRQVLDTLPEQVAVSRRPQQVVELNPTDDGWSVVTQDSTDQFDEVLITIGHEGWRSGRSATVAADCPDVIDRVFPVDRQLNQQRVPADCVVGIQGFALTFIDACLSLTEGRGGRFHCDQQQWTYEPSGREPRVILPLSRTGRPALPKPAADKLDLPEELSETWLRAAEHLARVPSHGQGLNFLLSVWPVVLKSAAEALRIVRQNQAGDPSAMIQRMAVWFRRWSTHRMSPPNVAKRLKQSWRIAVGLEDPDEAWALGEAWRQLYPQLVRRISHGGLAPDSWPAFRRYAAEMERLAFGPPAQNTGRINALIDCGIVDLRFLHSTVQHTDDTLELRCHNRRLRVDRLVNAVIPASNDFAVPSVLSRLADAGLLTHLEGAQGIHVDPAGRPLQHDGQTVSGLAVIGRPTEGCVLGNDTLSRRLHEHPDRWAEDVCQRITARKSCL